MPELATKQKSAALRRRFFIPKRSTIAVHLRVCMRVQIIRAGCAGP
jgi:hypothetical protein